MRTQAQIAASRANRAKSNGPITTIGRAISAQNATVHGLAVLLRGPLRSMSEREKTHLEAQVLAFIGAAVT